jgi:transcriptional regulator with XRE-family HTH domain
MGFAERLRELMAERGISGRELARRVPCDRSYISLLAQGKRQPSAQIGRKLDELLDAGGALADIAVAPVPGGFDADTVLAGFAGAEHAGRADDDYVQALRETSQYLVRMDGAYGGADVLPVALRAFRAAAGMLATRAYEPAVRRDLQAACGEAGEVAAWVAYDADRQELSRQLAHEALFVSRLAGDRDMELFTLGHLAMQDVHLHRPAEALGIAEHVMASRRLPARVGALFELRRGRALAQLGDAGSAVTSIRHARSVISEGAGPRDPYWTWWIDDLEITWHEGMARADAGDWRSAMPLLETNAYECAGSARCRYNDHAHLLDAQAHVGAWADAQPVAVKVTGMVGVISSARTARLLRKVARQITTAGPPAISEAAHDLTVALRLAS